MSRITSAWDEGFGKIIRNREPAPPFWQTFSFSVFSVLLLCVFATLRLCVELNRDFHVVRMDESSAYFQSMDIVLPPDLEAYVQERVRSGAFASSKELIQEALRRKMEEDSWLEQKVLEAEEFELSPLTREDLQSVRRLIRQPRAVRAS